MLDDVHLVSGKKANFTKNLRKSMLGKGVSMEEDGGDDLEIAFDVIQDMVFVKDYRPRLHPPRH